MYKLILAEDEEDVREGIIAQIDWEQYGFEVVEQAENGREAAEAVDRHMPDVVVTDIQMPFMNGLQLAEWIRSRHPNTKIIILTGFDEFEYAQKAIKLQIDEYILKPFSSQELIDVLLKVRTAIEAEIAEKENIYVLSEHYRKSLPVLREQFLSSLVSRRLPLQEISDKSSEYSIDLAGRQFQASVISIDYIHSGEQEGAAAGRHISLRDTGDHNLQLFAILNIAEEICQKHAFGRVFIHRDDVVLLSASQAADEAEITGSTLTVLEEIRQNVQRYLKLTVTAGAGTVCRSAGMLFNSFADAVQALDYRLILGNNRVIWIEDVESRAHQLPAFDELTQQSLIRTIKLGTVQELKQVVDELFGGLDTAQVSTQDYQIFLLEIITSILRVARESGSEAADFIGPGLSTLSELHKFNNMGEAKEWIIRICTRLMDSIASERQSSYKQLMDQAKDYIRSHYEESDISIGRVCQHLHISTGYFSSIFKKEMKMTFVSYLLQIRLEAAKELLRSTELKAFEIAEKIGFSDPNYFSFCFRKKYGQSPKEYKNSSRGG
ncbi:transcriptional regulator [Paenibacillus sp. FSL R7-0273]|uniref:response regulator n=1 Tax=Paenibacillus sp. FSL R7-0273 TaxID=1536772 RepID=UPI0004F63E69|nr:response regulator [Paenibacillus sp. FSL R7-0273]AIQ48109.1 transcriptional regulator [Paenibacillus sp. FSL R7-0273]OMF91871.1 DNA-binding response regulator [Paenibacillus sp. FSL R7-0273]